MPERASPNCEAVILAAGLGTRMKGTVPKALQPLGEQPLIRWSVAACQTACGRAPWVVIGPDQELVISQADAAVHPVVQSERLGTGHALLQAKAELQGRSDLVLVTNVDMPLLQAATLQQLIQLQSENPGPISMLTVHSSRSRGFGRVLRDAAGRVQAIQEEAVASPLELAGTELNVGAYCYRADWLWQQLPSIPISEKGEYYLTDLVGMAVSAKEQIAALLLEDADEAIGINSLLDLADAEAALRKRINQGWMQAGVRMQDPATTYIGPRARLGAGTVILANTHIEGATQVGQDCQIGPNSILREASIGDRCRVEASVIEGSVLEEQVEVGPFARLRAGTRLGPGVHVGNFGEIKNSSLGPGVKVGHFSYIGDASIGGGVNVGAGTITVNYDGKQKHRTEIGEGAFIGSDTMLVAPVRIGKGARTGAGSVVTRDVPERTLAVGVPARAIRKLDSDD